MANIQKRNGKWQARYRGPDGRERSLRFHDLRHTCAAILVTDGRPSLMASKRCSRRPSQRLLRTIRGQVGGLCCSQARNRTPYRRPYLLCFRDLYPEMWTTGVTIWP